MTKSVLMTGALASLGCASTFIFGLMLLFTQLLPYIVLKHSPEEAVAFVLEHHAVLGVWNFVIYIVFGFLLAILVTVLHHQFSPDRPVISQVSAAIGYVWATLVIASGMLASVGLTRVVGLADLHPDLATSLWLSIFTIKEGVGGSNEIVGGVWTLLVSLMFWRNRPYPNALAILGMVAGAAGIISAIPAISDLGAVFGLLLIAWFASIGWVMMREVTTTNQGGKRFGWHSGNRSIKSPISISRVTSLCWPMAIKALIRSLPRGKSVTSRASENDPNRSRQ